MNCVIVEDSPVVRLMFAKIFEGTDVAIVAECTSGDEALEKLDQLAQAEQIPDILITDMRMPGKANGLAVCERALALGISKVILATSHLDNGMVLPQGVALLSKPFRIPDLFQLTGSAEPTR